jgi:hypothetical protein
MPVVPSGAARCRIVEHVNQFFTRAVRQPVGIDTQGDRRILVPQLATHVRDGRAVLQLQRCERVPHLVRSASIEFGRVEDAIERLPNVRLIVILAVGKNRRQIEAFVEEDPFCEKGLADFRIIEFRARQRATDIQKRLAQE